MIELDDWQGEDIVGNVVVIVYEDVREVWDIEYYEDQEKQLQC